DLDKAIKAYRVFVKKFAYSSRVADAQWKIAVLTERTGNDSAAFDAYDDYIKKYRRGENFDKAVEAQFNIATRFLNGEKVKYILGIKASASVIRAQQMFEKIIANAAYSKYAPLSQFNIGQALEKQDKPMDAIAAYQTLQTKYPNDPIAADAQYQIGYVYMKQSRAEGVYDPGAGSKASDAFEDFVARYPNSEKVPQAQENIKLLAGRGTKSAFEIAKYYDKQKQYKSAVIYYNDVIQQQPGTPESDQAKARIEALKGIVGEDALQPGPPRTENGERATKSRKLQAQVDTSARPDYLGPPVSVPVQTAPATPKLRTSPGDIPAPASSGTGAPPPVNPELPAQ
ncbi:MAG TPA: outer membrane protein assembly factor BamD, partial [Chthoniobacteraceae bacterium]|nr:outer membrane protein assembly factor BamD [Chthoniobacteraceae bacterium]